MVTAVLGMTFGATWIWRYAPWRSMTEKIVFLIERHSKISKTRNRVFVRNCDTVHTAIVPASTERDKIISRNKNEEETTRESLSVVFDRS